ncbi:hypothetical protein PsYK624_054790 [Phanerochaete sordida]|uniref:Uncharacterized protein n=1 Tax=Phanerochaete sordida TaxID=48140 RepID=A0A9P3LCA8_9APHY|nr:hypothetical protein PsYK624_054790 [Phanerochaete sordida]
MPYVAHEYANGLRRRIVVAIAEAVQAKSDEDMTTVATGLQWASGRWYKGHGASTSTFGNAVQHFKLASMLGFDGHYHVVLCEAVGLMADPTYYYMRFKFTSPPSGAELRNAINWACSNFS